MKSLRLAVLCAALLAPSAWAEDPPSLMTLDLLVGKHYAGGWMSEYTSADGVTFKATLMLKEDGTYENYLITEGGGKPPISANGRGVWFARINASDGGIEIALTSDPDEKNPTWILRTLAIEAMTDGDKVWHR